MFGGLEVYKADKHMRIKRYEAYKIGNRIFVHRTRYKQMCRNKKDLTGIIKRITHIKEMPGLENLFLFKSF